MTRWMLVIGYVGAVGALLSFGVVPVAPTVSIWDAQDTGTLIGWGEQLVLAGILQVVATVVLGWLVGLAVWKPYCDEQKADRSEEKTADEETRSDALRRDEGICRRFGVGRWLIAVGLGLGLTTLLVTLPLLRWPTPTRLVLPCSGCLLGVWCARWWRGGWPARLALSVQLVVLAATLVGGGGWAMTRALENEPLAVNAARVTSAEKRRIVRVLRSRGKRERNVRTLELTEHDVNVLISWGLTVGSGGRKAVAELGEGRANGRVSVALPRSGSRKVYFNALAAGRLAIDAGDVDFELTRLRIGRLELPRLVLVAIARAAIDTVKHDPDLGEVVRSTERLTIKPGKLEIIARRGLVHDHISSRVLARLGAKPDVAATTADYVRHLVDVAPELPRGDAQFVALVRAAFKFARQRSADSVDDPVLENRAALLALGILLGHARVEKLVGEVTHRELHARSRSVIGRVTLRSRRDWTQHFWVSAAIALMSNNAVSDAVGLLKEELDAGGSSGFSFSDLLADMAGTRFALYVTRDATTARASQEWLAGDVTVDELFPPAVDLPEGIPDARLQADYGGVGGDGYRAMIRELEKRLGTCRYGQ